MEATDSQETVGRTFGLGNQLEETGGACRRCHNVNNYRVWRMHFGHAAVPLIDRREMAENEFWGEFKGSDENRSEQQRASQWTPSVVASDAMERPTRED